MWKSISNEITVAQEENSLLKDHFPVALRQEKRWREEKKAEKQETKRICQRRVSDKPKNDFTRVHTAIMNLYGNPLQRMQHPRLDQIC